MPTSPLTDYLKLQRALDRDMLKVLRASAFNIDSQLRFLQSRSGIGAAVREAQLRLTQQAIHQEMARMWEAAGDLVEAQRAVAAGVAAEGMLNQSSELLSSVFSAADRDYLMRSARASAERNLETLQERVSGSSKRPLSQAVYDSKAWTDGKIDDIINQALASGKSAAELAKDVRGFINPNTPGGARYASMRLGRTELNNSFHASQVRQAQKEPWTTGLKWNLSGSHPVPDECNQYAEDTHVDGGGAGVFDPMEVPGKPHPNCLCYTTPETVDRDAFIKQFESGDYDDYLEELSLPLEKREIARQKAAEWGGKNAFVDPEGGKALQNSLDSIAPTPPRPSQPWLQDTYDFTLSQRAGDPNVGMIASRGVRMDGSTATRNLGVDGQCHWNTSSLFEAGEVDDIVIGYVHSDEVGWIQHTWGRKNGQIVETNYSVRADTYFGVPLTPEEASSFAEWCRLNRPGMGMVRHASNA